MEVIQKSLCTDALGGARDLYDLQWVCVCVHREFWITVHFQLPRKIAFNGEGLLAPARQYYNGVPWHTARCSSNHFLTLLNSSAYNKTILNDKFGITWKDVIVTYLKLRFHNLPTTIAENIKYMLREMNLGHSNSEEELTAQVSISSLNYNIFFLFWFFVIMKVLFRNIVVYYIWVWSTGMACRPTKFITVNI